MVVVCYCDPFCVSMRNFWKSKSKLTFSCIHFTPTISIHIHSYPTPLRDVIISNSWVRLKMWSKFHVSKVHVPTFELLCGRQMAKVLIKKIEITMNWRWILTVWRAVTLLGHIHDSRGNSAQFFGPYQNEIPRPRNFIEYTHMQMCTYIIYII